MIKIQAIIDEEEIKKSGYSTQKSSIKTVRVDKIRVRNGRYEARLSNKKTDAPYDVNEWVYLNKSINKSEKIPALQEGWVLLV